MEVKEGKFLKGLMYLYSLGGEDKPMVFLCLVWYRVQTLKREVFLKAEEVAGRNGRTRQLVAWHKEISSEGVVPLWPWPVAALYPSPSLK